MILLISVGAKASDSVLAASENYCHRYFKTTFIEDFLPGCQFGDMLVLQLNKESAPGPIIAQVCDLRLS